MSGELIYRTDFASMDDFWAEGSPDVSVSGNELIIRTTFERDPKTHFVCSVFLRKVFTGNLLVEYEGQSRDKRSARNFNFFIHTAGPDGRDLYDTRRERNGGYDQYHALSNYLFTCVASDRKTPDGSDKMRIRMRRDPGFVLMSEAHSHRSENFRWYAFQYLVRDGEVSLCVDHLPQETYTWRDPKPLTAGYLGFRTYMSHLALRNFRVYQL